MVWKSTVCEKEARLIQDTISNRPKPATTVRIHIRWICTPGSISAYLLWPFVHFRLNSLWCKRPFIPLQSPEWLELELVGIFWWEIGSGWLGFGSGVYIFGLCFFFLNTDLSKWFLDTIGERYTPQNSQNPPGLRALIQPGLEEGLESESPTSQVSALTNGL